jgi:RNA polymerase sigma factor (sigma-70 family)
MSKALSTNWMTTEQDQRISEAFGLERARLRNFIRRRVPDENDVEDILQDAFYELVEAYRLMKPVEQVSAWLFRVVRNRITDLFRKKRPGAMAEAPANATEDGEKLLLEELIPSPDAGPENWMRPWTSCPKSNAMYSSPTNWRVTVSKRLQRRRACP